MIPPLGARLLGQVAATEKLGAFCWITLEVPGWLAMVGERIDPGRFALLQAEPSRCFLPRAFSIADQDGELISFLMAPVGEGSRELTGLAVGSDVWVLGPLGRGFALGEMAVRTEPPGPRPSGVRPRLVVVGGGAGIAPFPLLLRRIADLSGPGSEAVGHGFSEVLVVLGYRDMTQVEGGAPVRTAVNSLRQRGIACALVEVTEDGSCGPAGLVTSPLAEHLREGDRVVACGPEAMNAAVWDICRKTRGASAWFSLEAGMACGVGSCHGCVVRLANGSLARVCHDGPVFKGETIFAVADSGPGMERP